MTGALAGDVYTAGVGIEGSGLIVELKYDLVLPVVAELMVEHFKDEWAIDSEVGDAAPFARIHLVVGYTTCI